MFRPDPDQYIRFLAFAIAFVIAFTITFSIIITVAF